MNKTLIVIPTYNEKENISNLIATIRRQKVQADVLVVDDNSPDQTGKIVETLRRTDKSLFALHRKKKNGLGRAYAAGFKWGLGHGYTKMISMDADFSHPVDVLPKLIEICNPKTVAIGSRYVKGGKIEGWAFNRYLNSYCANFVTRIMLGIKAKDVTAGFKCYPAEFLISIDLENIKSGGYAFQPEMLLLAQDRNFVLAETPITFVDRQAGKSKIKGELLRSSKIIFRIALSRKGMRQFIKFGIVGFINAGIDWAIFFILKLILPGILGFLNPQQLKQLAKAVSFIVSALSSYAMNRRWTFRSTRKDVGREAFKFFVVATGGFVINNAAFYLITAIVGWNDVWGLLAASGAATFWNFFLNKKWTFKGL